MSVRIIHKTKLAASIHGLSEGAWGSMVQPADQIGLMWILLEFSV